MADTIEGLIGMLPKQLDDKAKIVDTVIQLIVTGSQAGQWNIVIKDAKLNVAKGTHAAPELTVTADADDILAVANGKLDPTKALMLGKIKAKGDMTDAIKLVQLFMSQ